jgi:hypothetical protein
VWSSTTETPPAAVPQPVPQEAHPSQPTPPSLRKPVRLTRTPPDLPGQTAQSRVLPYCEPLGQAAAYQGSRLRWRATLGGPGVL